MMRILYCADQFPGFHRQVGGAEHALADVMEAAQRAGHATAVASRKADLAEPRHDVPFFRVRCINDWNRQRPFFEWELLKTGVPVDPLTRHGFRRALKRWRPDIVHFGNIHRLTFVPARDARRQGIPSVFSVYDYWAVCPRTTLLNASGEICGHGHSADCIACMSARKLARRYGLRRRARAFAHGLSSFDRVVVLSRHSAERMQQAGVGAHAIRVIPLPVSDIARGGRDAESAARQAEFVYVGWIQRRKGLKVAVRALAQVKENVPSARLSIIGELSEPDYAAEVQGEVTAHGLASSVEFLGRIPRDQVQQRMLQAAAVVVPEQWENVSPVIVAEALACGTPVVASDVGGIAESLEHGKEGFLVPKGDPSAFAEAMLKLIEDPSLNSRMSTNARKADRSGRTVDEISDAWMRLYEELLEETRT